MLAKQRLMQCNSSGLYDLKIMTYFLDSPETRNGIFSALCFTAKGQECMQTRRITYWKAMAACSGDEWPS